MSEVSRDLFLDKLAVKADPKVFLRYPTGHRNPRNYFAYSNGIKQARIQQRLAEENSEQIRKLIEKTSPEDFIRGIGLEDAAKPNTGAAMGVQEIKNRLLAKTLPEVEGGMPVADRYVADMIFGPTRELPLGAYTDWFRKYDPRFGTPLAGPKGKLPG